VRADFTKKKTHNLMQMQQQQQQLLGFAPRLVLSKDTPILLNFQSTQERKQERKKEIRTSKKFFTKLQALHTKKKKKKLECGCVLQGLPVMKKAMF
jgi:hypothetical protein